VKRVVQAVVGLAVSGVALWLTLRNKDLGAIAAAMRAADYRYLFPFVAVLLFLHVVKAVRWGLLLRPLEKVPFGRLNAVSAVGFMALMILPFRLGEFARPVLIASPRLRTSAALSSIVVERAADGLFTGVLMVVALLAVPEGTPRVGLLRTAGYVVCGAFAAVLVFLAFAYQHRARAVRIVTAAIRPFSQRLADRGASMLDAFIHGLRVLPGPGSVAVFFALTAVYWLVNAWSMGILARGFGFDFSFATCCTLLGVLVVGVMIPAGPGMVGTFQGALVLGLTIFAPPEAVATRGTAYANVLWAVQLAQVTGVGLAFLFTRHIQMSRLLGAPRRVGAGLEEEEAEYRASGDGAG
jgi:uncharacterized protein (TIRG00374 family)